jgi:hypothetical protein
MRGRATPPRPSTPASRVRRLTSQFENYYFTEMCSGSEAGEYLRLMDFVYRSTLGLREVKEKKKFDLFVSGVLSARSRLWGFGLQVWGSGFRVWR